MVYYLKCHQLWLSALTSAIAKGAFSDNGRDQHSSKYIYV